MRINHAKTKIMLFNSAKKHDFQPELSMEGVKLEVVEKMKLLGVIITSDLTWDENTEFITNKAFSRLWLLRRLKKLGASRAALCDIYAKNVRSVLEFSAAVWHSRDRKVENFPDSSIYRVKTFRTGKKCVNQIFAIKMCVNYNFAPKRWFNSRFICLSV